MKLTLEELERGKSKNGGWTKEQLAKWGVDWPPRKGWKKSLLTGKPVKSKKKSRKTFKTFKPYDWQGAKLDKIFMDIMDQD